jgi:hypothetical protein
MTTETAPPQVSKKPSSRTTGYIILLGILCAIIAAAYFQEQISAYFRLRLWDAGAPGRTVVTFLEAGKKGDKALADSLLAATSYQPVKKNGKWSGYRVVSMAGAMDFLFEDLIGADNPRVTSTEFVTIGEGAAKVEVTNAKGQPVKYRVTMTDGGWKVSEILSGRQVK